MSPIRTTWGADNIVERSTLLFETARLWVRRFADSDLSSFLAYRNDPQIALYQSWEHVTEPEAADFIAEQQILLWGLRGTGYQFALEQKESSVLVGDCYLKVEVGSAKEAEIGYTLASAFHRQGLGTEAVRGLLDYAFSTFDLGRVTATTDERNAASIALLEKVGFVKEEADLPPVWFKNEWCVEYRYAIQKVDWVRKHSSR